MISSKIVIRPATAGDLDALEAIEQSCFGCMGDAFSRRVLRYLVGQAQGAVFVAVHDGCVVGYISLLARRTAVNLRIYSVAVLPEARGLGAGQALLDAAVAEAQRCGARELTLEVRTDNAAALALYRKNGFMPDRMLPGYYHDGAEGCRLRRTVEK